MVLHLKVFTSDPAGTRTQDPYIKSVMLYQLSYGIIDNQRLPAQFVFGSAKIHEIAFVPKLMKIILSS